MIIEITKDNLNELDNSLEWLKEEFENNPFAKLLIIKEKDEIIGYLYYSDIYERAEINQFEVKETHRNCGKGQLLLESCLKILNKDITLEVRQDNIPAIKLYEKNGFEKKAIRPNYYPNQDGILMERKVNKLK